MIRTIAHTALATATSAAILLTTLLADAAAPAPAPAAPPAGAVCVRGPTTVRPSDGAIITHKVCVVAEVGK